MQTLGIVDAQLLFGSIHLQTLSECKHTAAGLDDAVDGHLVLITVAGLSICPFAGCSLQGSHVVSIALGEVPRLCLHSCAQPEQQGHHGENK